MYLRVSIHAHAVSIIPPSPSSYLIKDRYAFKGSRYLSKDNIITQKNILFQLKTQTINVNRLVLLTDLPIKVCPISNVSLKQIPVTYLTAGST